MKRGQALNLYVNIRDLKNGNLSKEALVKYIILRLKLKKVADEFEAARQEISEQTKPVKFKDGDDTKEWEEKYQLIAQKWLDDEVDIDCKIFTIEEAVDLISGNDMVGVVGDFVVEMLVKD